MSGASHGFPVRQEEDSLPSSRLLRVAVLSVGAGVLGVALSVVLLETNTGGIRGERSPPVAPSIGERALAGVDQAPIADSPAPAEVRARQRSALSQYQWVDRDAGLASIPIERAMDLLVEGAP
jgi:hypothetical protein